MTTMDFNYHFAQETEAGSHISRSFSKTYDDMTSWDDVLMEYVEFLSFVYGYDLKKYITIDSPHYKDLK